LGVFVKAKILKCSGSLRLIDLQPIWSLNGLPDLSNCHVPPCAVIVQDLAMRQFVRQAPLEFDMHGSTLCDPTFPASLHLVRLKSQLDTSLNSNPGFKSSGWANTSE
jgi:hypothetical protein